ncbi:MAG: radical SAM protein [Candidatus Electrothrix sp. MAN1_4]|nr:radical SAM protein [Candidatus Electrothrix sp. MAN1_4]
MKTGKTIVGVCFLITTKCNLRCNICYANLNSVENSSQKVYLEIIAKIAAFGAKKITFTGGEPLLVKHIETLLAKAKELDLKVALTTNANLMNLEKLKRLECYIDEISVPMDGYSNDVLSVHRTIKHDHENVRNIIRYARYFDVKVDVSTVLTRHNSHEVEYLLDMLQENNIYKWKIFQYSKLNKPKGESIDFNISKYHYQKILKRIKKKINSLNYTVQVDSRSNSIAAINSYVTVLPDGTLMLTKDNSYINIGNILCCHNDGELTDTLVKNGFSFTEHYRRHYRDI